MRKYRVLISGEARRMLTEHVFFLYKNREGLAPPDVLESLFLRFFLRLLFHQHPLDP